MTSVFDLFLNQLREASRDYDASVARIADRRLAGAGNRLVLPPVAVPGPTVAGPSSTDLLPPRPSPERRPRGRAGVVVPFAPRKRTRPAANFA
jgi:hypothetical protein